MVPVPVMISIPVPAPYAASDTGPAKPASVLFATSSAVTVMLNGTFASCGDAIVLMPK